MREWRKTNPLEGEARKRSNARSYANQYLKRGKIDRRCCRICGSPDAEMHHPNHELPLQVTWLCRDHHLAWHEFWRQCSAETWNLWLEMMLSAPFAKAAGRGLSDEREALILMALKTRPPRLAPHDTRTTRPLPKQADAELLTPEHRAWRLAVCRRAGWRCEWVEQGRRCEASATRGDKMYADHVVERADGGARYDTDNGMCVCSPHHVKKTYAERAKRINGMTL